jgi:nucleotide-binding universal stress UspA family protein
MFLSVIDHSPEIQRLPTADGPSLVAVVLDGSPTSWRAFAWALGHARRSRCPILAIYAARSARSMAAMAYLFPLSASAPVDDLVRRSEAMVADDVRHEAERSAAECGVPIRFREMTGASPRALLAAAARDGADLLVTGARRPLSRGRGRSVPLVVIP